MKVLIRCENCQSLNVDEFEVPPPPPEPQKPEILTMDEYIKRNGYRSSTTGWFSGNYNVVCGTSTTKKMKLHCFDCGFEKEWNQVVYI